MLVCYCMERSERSVRGVRCRWKSRRLWVAARLGRSQVLAAFSFVLLQHAFQLHSYLLIACINVLGLMLKVWLVSYTLCLDQSGFILCWVTLLEHTLGGLMEHSLILIYFMLFIHVMQEHDACLIGTWRTTQENRTTIRHMTLSWLNN
jgi:hypothetical protein